MAAVATSTPKRHGFSIESLIGRRDDSPGRQPLTLLSPPRPEDFSRTRDVVCKDSLQPLDVSVKDRARDSMHRVQSFRDSVREAHSNSASLRHVGLDSSRETHRDMFRDSIREAHRDSVRDSIREVHRDTFRDTFRDSIRDANRESMRDANRDSARDVNRDSQRETLRDPYRDTPSRSRSRQGTVSPSSPPEEDRVGRRSSSPASPTLVSPTLVSPSLVSPNLVSPRVLDKTLPSSSPETENRLSGWSSEDFKHLLGSGAFQHHSQQLPGVDSPGVFQPLRVCNRSLSAAMNTAAAFMPPQLAGLPLSPLLYNLHRDLTPHHPAHPLLAARYPGFVPRYPLGPPPGLLFHPYRKPKRNRTAFSPSQLLQLEQAFEKNHYVVGQERKTLASKLQLTETQVKVWFQNRRTKHKRMKAEEEATGGVTSGDETGKMGDNTEGQTDIKSDASDHELLEDDVCSSDEELSVTEDS